MERLNMDQFKPIAGVQAERKDEVSAQVTQWVKALEERAIFPAANLELVKNTALEAKEKNCPLPLILTLCPATRSLEAGSKGPTREIVPMSAENPRLKSFLEELVSFMVLTKRTLGTDVEVFLILADRLDPFSARVFANANKLPEISQASATAIKQLFFQIDQENPGLFQKERIRVPKVWKQSDSPFQKEGREDLIRKCALDIVQLKEPFFSIWLTNLKRTREDEEFIGTGWQNFESAKTTWDRFTFKLSECLVDGHLLPRMFSGLDSAKKRFPNVMPKPIFVATSMRQNGVLLEIDSFNSLEQFGVIAPFRNVGRWNDPVVQSPWNLDSASDILES